MKKIVSLHEKNMQLVKDGKKVMLFLKTEMVIFLVYFFIQILNSLYFYLLDIPVDMFLPNAAREAIILSLSGIIIVFFLWKLYSSLLKKPYRYNKAAKWYCILSYGIFSQGVFMAVVNQNSKNYDIFGYTFHFLFWMGTFGVFMGYSTWIGIKFEKLQDITENNA